MLSKLMKHELKATSRILIPLYIALLCISIINHFTFKYGAEEGIFASITGFLMMTQVLFIMAILIVTVIFMITRFYKNFFSDEGYLMFTLPVNTNQLILSKLIVTLFWAFIYAIGAAFSWIIVMSSLNDINLFSEIINRIQEMLVQLNNTFGLKWIVILSELAILAILILVLNILIVYTSIAIGQLFKKYKIVASFISYIAIRFILQLVTFAGMFTLGYMFPESRISVNMVPNALLITGIVVYLIGCGIFYTATNYIFSRKLNLE